LHHNHFINEHRLSMTAVLSAAVQQQFATWLNQQRWFGGKGRLITGMQVLHEQVLNSESQQALQWLEITYDHGTPEVYLTAWNANAWQQQLPATEWLADATTNSVLWEVLTKHALTTWRSPEFWARSHAGVSGSIQLASFEQSNTCLIVDGQYILKLYRKQTPGQNPDAELGQFLASSDTVVSPRLQAILSTEQQGETWVIGTMQQLLPGATTAWEELLNCLEQDLLQESATIPATATQTFVAKLGQLTANMHNQLASGKASALVPEPWTNTDSQRAATKQRSYSEQQLSLLQERLATLPLQSQSLARGIIVQQERLLERFSHWHTIDDIGHKFRIHGDYHLGQVLVTQSAGQMQLWVIDFEGEPARPIAERREKKLPWQDVAGMLRSLNYAMIVATRNVLAHRQQSANSIDLTNVQQGTANLEQCFLQAYLETVRHPAIQATAANTVLPLLVLEKAFYELGYELLNRPDWVEVPLLGIQSLLN
jgi:maltose alpha-D-glucosyltransferase / alpha-amylase